MRTHLSYRKISRTHSTPVSSTKLLFVLTSDFCVRLSTHFRCSSFSTVLTSMQGSHSSIFDVLCTHFRFTNKQLYSLPEGNQNVLTSECLVIFPPILISKKRIHRNSATTTTPWRAPPLLQRRRAAPLTPPRPLPGVSLRRWAFLSPAVDGMERLPFRARAGRPSRRTPCPSEPHMPRCGGRSTASTPTRTPTAHSRANRSLPRSTRSSSSSCRWLGPR